MQIRLKHGFFKEKILYFGWCCQQEYNGLLCINVANKEQLIIYHEYGQ